MKAAVLGSQGLEIQDIAAPKPGPDDVLVRVRAAGLNHADLGILAGHMHGAIGGVGTVLGMEWAGEVLAVGANVSHVRVGDRVIGSGRGALAEQAVTDRGRVLPWPNDGLGFEPEARTSRGKRLGLTSMRDRAYSLGGRLTIDSAPGHGATVRLEIPA